MVYGQEFLEKKIKQEQWCMVKKRIRQALIILVFVWMAVIFGLSSRPASLSSKDSYRVGKLFSELFVPGFKQWPAKDQDRYIRSIDRPIRKTAHACEYAILAMLTSGVFLVQSLLSGDKVKKLVPNLLHGVAVSALFACTDEFHQRFVQGRAGSLIDVCIDTAGALVGVIILGVVLHVCRRLAAAMKKRRQF
jgi:VanZ family protein